MQRTHTRFRLRFFVAVENNRLVNPTPKGKVADWKRAGHRLLTNENRTLLFRS